MPASWRHPQRPSVKLRRQYGLHGPGTCGIVTERTHVATKIDGTGMKIVRVRIGDQAYRLSRDLFDELFELGPLP
jgi:hypothetical protein